MKRRIISFLSASILCFGLFSIIASAQIQNQPLSREAIVSYSVRVIVDTDNSVDVAETIIYNTGQEEHHGIYRDIHPYSSQNRKMSIGNIVATDENNNPYPFSVSNAGENIRIKIGDPNQTFKGQKTYVIRYKATKAVAQFKDFDEIYWNATGNNWGMPILQAQASVILPTNASMKQSACYYGPQKSANRCQLANDTDKIYTFKSPFALNPQEGLTVAVGFSKGAVSAYSSLDNTRTFFDRYGRWFILAILPTLTLIFSMLNWCKKGRDDRKIDVIIPQYDVPDELSPLEIGGIINEKIKTGDISAEIIYLATKGYLKIRQISETRFAGLIKSTDYELTRLKDSSESQNDFDRKLLQSLFFFQSETVKISDLKNLFYENTHSIINLVLNNLLSKGYYKNLGKMRPSISGKLILFFLAFITSLFVANLTGDFLSIAIAITSSILIYSIFYYFSPAKTEKGVKAKEYILGLKDYLQIAEKDRLQFHNAPEKNPEVFEKLLPYAMVLGVSEIWAKEFEGIYTTPPAWYSGSSDNLFSSIVLSRSLSDFSSFASSAIISSPSGSGSGGGGFSGGGGGGGGGGSW